MILWNITPFIDYPSDAYGYRFEWEREWRVPGDLELTPEDVAFLFLPEELHQAARSFFQNAIYEHAGPGYLGSYLDPLWPDETLQEVLRHSQL